MREKSAYSHLMNSDSLVTTYEQTRAGFIEQALEKNNLASDIVKEAKVLKKLAAKAKKAEDLFKIKEIKGGLLTASGISNKAKNYINTEEAENELINKLIEKFLLPAGKMFVEELVYRYLLIRGDELGGRSRNLAGLLAEKKLISYFVSSLKLQKVPYKWLLSNSKKWKSREIDFNAVNNKYKGLSWKKNGKIRSLIFNIKVPTVDKGVDLCLLDCEPKEFRESLIDPKKYIALGELKGGIDPAGADEHWKTGNTALSRIRNAFAKKDQSPAIFFLAAAIAKNMAKEIWNQLNTGKLSNAGNMTNDDHVISVCQWLINL